MQDTVLGVLRGVACGRPEWEGPSGGTYPSSFPDGESGTQKSVVKVTPLATMGLSHRMTTRDDFTLPRRELGVPQSSILLH